MADPLHDTTARRSWLGLMARAPDGRVSTLFAEACMTPAFRWLRAPEIGSVMIRGRTGGTGTPFNLGEMTVTRCALALETGPVGHGYVQGRRKDDAEAAALVDALMQTSAAATLRDIVLAPLEAEDRDQKRRRARKAAATKVEFFTLARGED